MRFQLTLLFLFSTNLLLAQESGGEYVRLIKNQVVESKASTYKLVGGQVYLIVAHPNFNTENLKLLRRESEHTYLVKAGSNYELKSNRGEIKVFETYDHWKVSTQLFEALEDPYRILAVTISSLNLPDLLGLMKKLNIPVLQKHQGSKSVSTMVSVSIIQNHLIPDNNIMHIGGSIDVLSVEALVDDLDLSVNRVNVLHNNWPEYEGAPRLISVKEEMFDSADIDIRHRTTLLGLENENVSAHATQMATIIGGQGNSHRTGRGVANQVGYTSSDFNNVLPDDDDVFLNNNITIQNHSYGSDIDNRYSAEARAYDLSTNNNPEILHVFSAGNSGMEVSTNGNYTNIEGYSNLTGSFKMAKNILLVGAIDEVGQVNELNSRGPTYDGRLKPELVAYGKGGTSEAAALISGTSVLLSEYYRNLKGGNPSSALVKATLIAGADDVGVLGVDYITGYGNLNAYRSMQLIEDNQLGEVTLSKDEVVSLTFDVPANTRQLRLAVVWNDPAANIEDFKALTNDVDAEVVNASTLETWQPWILSQFAHADSLKKIAKRGIDNVNNVEFFTLDNPEAGTYQISLNGNGLSTSSQQVAYAYRIDEIDRFEWTFPMAIDKMVADELTYFRWDSNVLNSTDLEININGAGWQSVARNLDLNSGRYAWTVPNVLANALLRILVDGQWIQSDEFVISPEIDVNVGFICEDDFLLSWPPVESASAYEVYALQGKEMTLISTQLDTTIELTQSTNGDPYYAVSPVIDSKVGVRSLAYNYTQQGVGCYYRNFLASNIDNEYVQLLLNLSTTYEVKELVIERSVDDINYELVQSIIPASGQLAYEVQDDSPIEGYSYYSATIVLDDNSLISTESISVFFPGGNTLWVAPNPVASGDFITVLSKGGGRLFQLIDLQGHVVRELVLDVNQEEMDILLLQRGMYIYRMLDKNNKLSQGKLIVN